MRTKGNLRSTDQCRARFLTLMLTKQSQSPEQETPSTSEEPQFRPTPSSSFSPPFSYEPPQPLWPAAPNASPSGCHFMPLQNKNSIIGRKRKQTELTEEDEEQQEEQQEECLSAFSGALFADQKALFADQNRQKLTEFSTGSNLSTYSDTETAYSDPDTLYADSGSAFSGADTAYGDPGATYADPASTYDATPYDVTDPTTDPKSLSLFTDSLFVDEEEQDNSLAQLPPKTRAEVDKYLMFYEGMQRICERTNEVRANFKTQIYEATIKLHEAQIGKMNKKSACPQKVALSPRQIIFLRESRKNNQPTPTTERDQLKPLKYSDADLNSLMEEAHLNMMTGSPEKKQTPHFKRGVEKTKALSKFAKAYFQHTGLAWINTLRGPVKQFVWPARFLGDKRSVVIDDRRITVTTVSLHPKIFTVPNVLTHSECDHLMSRARMLGMNRSLTNAGVSASRTSTSCWLRRYDSKIVASIHERIKKLLDLRDSGDIFENMQIINYKPGQQFKVHTDYFPPRQYRNKPFHHSHRANRMCTILFYLNHYNEGDGGETVFPLSDGCPNSPDGIKVRMNKGGCVIFYNMLSDGNLDPLSSHCGSPVLSDEKWVATIWVWDPYCAIYDF